MNTKDLPTTDPAPSEFVRYPDLEDHQNEILDPARILEQPPRTETGKPREDAFGGFVALVRP